MVIIPAAILCLIPMKNQLIFPLKKMIAITSLALTIVILAGALIACCPVIKTVNNKKWYAPFAYVCSLLGLVVCMLSLASGTYNPFIYFRF